MVFHPLFRLGITSDLGVEDEKRGLKIGHMGAHLVPMRLQKNTPRRAGFGPLIAQGRIAQHLADRHAGGFQALQKPDPDEDRGVVVPLAGGITVDARQQPDPLVVAERMG